jgi:hypothetical protein
MKELTLNEYLEQERENSDMFLFIKHINPTMYKKYIRSDFEEEFIGGDEDDDLRKFQKTADLAFSKQLQTKKDGKLGRFRNIMKQYVKQRVQSRGNKNTNLIEVFDVLICSKHRL